MQYLDAINFRRSLRLSHEARERQDWHSEMHYGYLAILQGIGVGLIIGMSIAATYLMLA